MGNFPCCCSTYARSTSASSRSSPARSHARRRFSSWSRQGEPLLEDRDRRPTLSRLSVIPLQASIFDTPRTTSEITDLVQSLRVEQSSDTLIATIKKAKDTLDFDDSTLQSFLDAGIVPRLRDVWESSHSSEVQQHLLWVLLAISGGSRSQTQQLIEANIPHLLADSLSDDATPDRNALVVWVLGNIAAEFRDAVMSDTLVEKLLSFCDPSHVSSTNNDRVELIQQAFWTLGNFFRSPPRPSMNMFPESMCERLSVFLTDTNEQIVQEAAWLYAFLSDHEEQAQSSWAIHIARSDVLHQFAACLDPSKKTLQPALRVIGNVVLLDDARVLRRLVDGGILDRACGLLNDSDPYTRKETFWMVSNILCESRERTQKVFENGFVDKMIELLKTDVTSIQIEAVFCVSKLVLGCTFDDMKVLVERDILRLLFDILSKNLDVADATLDILEDMLEASGNNLVDGIDYVDVAIEKCHGWDKIAELQQMDGISGSSKYRAWKLCHKYVTHKGVTFDALN